MKKFCRGTSVCLAFLLWAAIALPAQTFTSLHNFDVTDGSIPAAGLVQGTDGNFYGTTYVGGAYGQGTIFKIIPSGTLTTLYNFCSQPGCSDGSNPLFGQLVQGSDGNFYGTTSGGGTGAYGAQGTVFKITPSGALTTLYNFCSQSNCTDGNFPDVGLVLGTDGNFYGTTAYGGDTSCSSGCGTVFSITPNGALTTLHSFSGTDGMSTDAALVRGTDGNFYGTTSNGGAGAYGAQGTVFKITPSGTLTTLWNFCSQPSCSDGSNPFGALVQGTDGNFYGTTQDQGGNGSDHNGTIFKITPSGTLTTLYAYADGLGQPVGLIQGTDGNLYGTTYDGGTGAYGSCDGGGCGTIFAITPSGTLTTLWNFCSQSGCSDGRNPHAGLVEATNGTFYGTAQAGGANGYGTVFSLSVPQPCTTTYTGTFKGNVNISSGVICITNGTITGNVTQSGGSLVTSDATIGGNLQITGGGTFSLASTTIDGDLQIQNIPAGTAQNQICGTDVKGNLQFHNNGTAVVIGNPSASCAGNVIGNDLQIQNNTASVQVYGDTVGGNLQCSSNSSIAGGSDTAKQTQCQCTGF